MFFKLNSNLIDCFFFYRVLAYDTEQLQFVADIRIPATDSSSIFVLSSRFHRYFLRNLNPNEVNTRILRLDNIPQRVAFAATPAPSILYTIPATTTHPANNLYTDHYFNSVRQPYRYETVGIINQSIKNPFAQLNTGEQPRIVHNSAVPHYSLLDTNSFVQNKLNSNFNDFNGLRVAKSSRAVAFNSSVVHD